MKPTATPVETDRIDMPQVAVIVREELRRAACPEHFVEIAYTAAEQAGDTAIRAAEARERARIIRWLRTVADTYASRLRAAAQGPDTIYWSDHLEAFSKAAEAISRRRHARPH